MKRHIGNLIQNELRRQERGVSWFARKLSCDRSNVYRIFRKQSIDTELLTRISLLLECDFFSVLSDEVREEQLQRESREREPHPETPRKETH